MELLRKDLFGYIHQARYL